jgi:hypothetical protein
MQSGTDACKIPAQRHLQRLAALQQQERIGGLEPRRFRQAKQKVLRRASDNIVSSSNYKLLLIIRQDLYSAYLTTCGSPLRIS